MNEGCASAKPGNRIIAPSRHTQEYASRGKASPLGLRGTAHVKLLRQLLALEPAIRNGRFRIYNQALQLHKK